MNGLGRAAALTGRVLLAVAAFYLPSSSVKAQETSSAPATLVLLDGTQRTIASGASLEIRERRLRGGGLSEELALDDLLRIELAASPTPRKDPALTLELRGRCLLNATDVRIARDACQIHWAGEPLSVPLELVRWISFAPTAPSDELSRLRAAPPADSDRVLVRDEDSRLVSLSATIDSLDSDRLTAITNGREQRIARSKLFAVVVAQPAAADPQPYCTIHFQDGSQLGGQVLSLVSGQARLSLIGDSEAQFPWTTVRRVSIRSPRMAYLSDLKPSSEAQQPIVTAPRPAQRDKSASGRPLQIGGEVYDNGLGVHARSALTFAADGKWDRLVATIGLDAAARGKGDCVFVVVADGDELLKRRMTSAEGPQRIDVPISGRSEVTLRVEPGADLDLADYADWAEARFIKER